MATDYTCRNCGAKFSAPEGAKARCPECLRVHGVGSGEEPVAAPPSRGRRWVVPVVVLGLVGAGVAIYLAKRHRGAPGGGGDADADPAVAAALRKKGIPAAEVVSPISNAKALAEAGRKALAGKKGARAQAEALWSLGEDLVKRSGGRVGAEDLLWTRGPREPAGAWKMLHGSSGGGIYDVELVGMLVSAARGAGVAAAGFEFADAGPRKWKAEPGPQLARLGVFVPEGKGKKGVVLDVERGGIAAAAKGRRLSDLELAGHLYNARAGSFFVHADGRRASRESEWATALVESPAVLATRGRVLLAFGQTKEGIATYRRAVDVGGQRARWWVALCMAYLQGERSEDALTACRAAVKQAPERAAARVALAYALLAEAEISEALKSVERAKTLEDTDAEVYKALGQVYAAQNELGKAKEALSRALRLDPHVRGVHLMRALMAMREMEFGEAAKELRAEVALQPDNERVRMVLASTLFRAGKKAEAEKELATMRARSKNRALTDRLIQQIRKEAEAEADDEVDEKEAVDGGAEEDGGTDDSVYQLRKPGERPRKSLFKLSP